MNVKVGWKLANNCNENVKTKTTGNHLQNGGLFGLFDSIHVTKVQHTDQYLLLIAIFAFLSTARKT